MSLTRMCFALLFLNACSTSPDIDLKDKGQVKRTLSAEWITSYMETIGTRVKIPGEQAMAMVFNSNGTFTSRVKNGVIER